MSSDGGWPDWFRDEDEQVFVELRECLADNEEELLKALKLLRFQRNLFPDASARSVLCAAGFPLAEPQPRQRVEPAEPAVVRSTATTPSQTFGPALAKVEAMGSFSPPASRWYPFLLVSLVSVGLLGWAVFRRYQNSKPPIRIRGTKGRVGGQQSSPAKETAGGTAEPSIRALLALAVRRPAAQRGPLLAEVDRLLRQSSDLPDPVHWRLAGQSRLLAGLVAEALDRFEKARVLGCQERELWLGMHRAHLLRGEDDQADQALRSGLGFGFDPVLWRIARQRGALIGHRALLEKLADEQIEVAEVQAADLSGDLAALRSFMERIARRRPAWIERSASLAEAWAALQK